jgi:hypothetical protein
MDLVNFAWIFLKKIYIELGSLSNLVGMLNELKHNGNAPQINSIFSGQVLAPLSRKPVL